MLENTSILPTYNASAEQSSAYIRQMLPLMMQYNVPVDPMNYAVWYHYVAGTSADLNKVIDDLIREQKPFDSKTTLNLYKAHICNASVESFEKINSNLLRLITQTTLSVIAATEKVSATGDNFNFKLKELKTVENETNLKSILFEIILETTQLAEASKALKNQLDVANKEMEQLRSELTHVREAANTDGLTGLLNRWAFDKALGKLVEKANSMNVCLVMMDIDHFKRVNDSFGHLVGDKVIKYFATLLKKYVAEHHHIARYGGEEMAIIMPDTTLEEAFHIIEQIRKTLDKSQLKHKGEETIGKVTVSAGIASLRAMDTADTFIERADNALYLAKETGRNKVVTENTIYPPDCMK
jgi:diguanylate cyclase